MNFGAEHDAQVQDRMREHLQSGETLRAAIWVSRADGRSSIPVTRTEMSPFRFRRPVPVAGAHRGVQGSPHSLAVALDEHIRNVTDPRILALTDRRLMVLSRRADLWRRVLRPASGPLPPLRVHWECPRADLASATEQAGRLRLTFTDRSGITLLTPSAGVQPFLAG